MQRPAGPAAGTLASHTNVQPASHHQPASCRMSMHKSPLHEHPLGHQHGWSFSRASSSPHLPSGLPRQLHRSIFGTNSVSVFGRESLVLGRQRWLAKRNRLLEHLRDHRARAGTPHQISYFRAGRCSRLCGALLPFRNEPPVCVHLSSFSIISLAAPGTQLRRFCIRSAHALHAPAPVRPNHSLPSCATANSDSSS